MSVLHVHGAVYGDNFGDVLIHNILAKQLARRGLTTRWPLSARKFILQQKALDWTPPKPPLNPTIGVVFGPGGYLSARQMAASHFEGSAWNRRFYTYHLPALLAARRFGKTAFFGLEIGPVPGGLPDAVVRSVVENAQLVAVRTAASASWLMENWGAKSMVIPDVALNLCPSLGRTREVGAAALLHVGDSRLWRADARFREAFRLLSKNFSTEIITDTSRLARSTAKAIDDSELRSRLRSYSGVAELLRKIAHANIVVTTKLHVSICAYALGVPVVQIAQHPKTHRFNESTDSQGQALQALQEFSPENLPYLIAAAAASSQSPLWRENRVREREALSGAFDSLVLAVTGGTDIS